VSKLILHQRTQNLHGLFIIITDYAYINKRRSAHRPSTPTSSAGSALHLAHSGYTHCFLCHNPFTSIAPIVQRGPISYFSPHVRRYLLTSRSFYFDIGPVGLSARLLSATPSRHSSRNTAITATCLRHEDGYWREIIRASDTAIIPFTGAPDHGSPWLPRSFQLFSSGRTPS
jgi:hypothetical protein